ncbi:hypothetical protein K438DRAFT_1977506 [Mycena galopus ATCC 62051]|nr:hypothetical protein K438DRAFT_1977506 [Mycena galopus ATCC 62051]
MDDGRRASRIPIYHYNQTVVLQSSLSTGRSARARARAAAAASQHQTIIGGGLQDGEGQGAEGHYCAPGEFREDAHRAPFLGRVGEGQEVDLIEGWQWIELATGASLSTPWRVDWDPTSALTRTTSGTDQVRYDLPPEPVLVQNHNEDENARVSVPVETHAQAERYGTRKWKILDVYTGNHLSISLNIEHAARINSSCMERPLLPSSFNRLHNIKKKSIRRAE